MEVGLTVGRWVLEPDAIPVLDTASASLVRTRVREVAAAAGLPDVPAAALVNAASELANNQVAHAEGRGYVTVQAVMRGDDRGVEVVAADAGPGIEDVARALEGRPTSKRSLGAGLAAVLELADEVDIDVRVGEGTCVRARKFARSESRRRRVGVYGRACPGERTSGDDATFVRAADALAIAVADGLGHGEPAREASERACAILRASPASDPKSILAHCDTALARTRGAVMAVARLPDGRGEVDTAIVGNVCAQLVRPGASRRFVGTSFVLGSPGGVRRIVSERQIADPFELMVLCSDGVSTRMDLEADPALLREHPVIVAQRIVERFGRDNDDATVLVAG